MVRRNQLLQGGKATTGRHRRGSLPICSLVCQRHPELQQGIKQRQVDEVDDLDFRSTHT